MTTLGAAAPKTPEVSVILPFRNAARHFDEALQSVLEQSFRDFELLLIDDGSTDGSMSICTEAADEDARVRIVQNRGSGTTRALNTGVALARAPLLARMDADDVAHRDRFRLQVEYLRRKRDVAVLGTGIRVVSATGEFLGAWPFETRRRRIAAQMEHSCAVVHPTVMMRTAVVRELGGYRIAFSAAQDYDLWLRALDSGYVIENHPSRLLDYRAHSESVTHTNVSGQQLGGLAARISHRLRRLGIAHSFADDSDGIDPRRMWSEVPHGQLLELRAAWALYMRDGWVGGGGWDLDAVREYLLATPARREPDGDRFGACWLIASDARRRGDSTATQWYWRAASASPSRAAGGLSRGLGRWLMRRVAD